jgi:cation diffusion facilitator CzcD-associated flavoprotein CzcO
MNARGGPQAYQGTAMDGFPNLFITIGPNTANGHTSILLAIENQVQYSLKFISKILKGDATIVEVKKSAEIAYTKKIQSALKDMIWTRGGCTSFYFMENGWNPTVYP